MQMTVEKCRVKMEVNYMGSIEIKQSVSRSSVASIWVKKRQDNWAKNDGINWALNLARNWREGEEGVERRRSVAERS